MTNLESQLASIHNKEMTSLSRIKELEEVLDMKKKGSVNWKEILV